MKIASLVRRTPFVPSASTVDRLTADDDLFVKLDTILGMPVVMQTVWRFPGTVDVDALRGVAERMLTGRMSRLVGRHRGPGRAYWRYTPEAGSVTVAAEPIPAGGEEAWARAQTDLPLDVVTGPAWRFAVARVADGSAVLVSLTIAHVIADGGSGTLAVMEAVHDLKYTPGTEPDLVDDAIDAADLLGSAASTAYRVWQESRTETPVTPERVTGTPAPDTDLATAQATPNVTVLVPANDFTAAAKARGGTDNSLFAALMVGLLERCGRVSKGDVMPLSLPVSTRTDPADRRANATSGARAYIEVSPSRYDDLTDIRVACKEAYERLAVRPGTVANRAVIMQALPQAAARRLAAQATNPLCLASNVGHVPDFFATLGTGVPADLAVRAVTAADDVTLLRDAKGGISGWLAINNGDVMFSVSSLDPVRIPDVAALRTLVTDELATWGLTGRSWGA
ncbi:hypothetical protein [Gordonia aurantiaca]|uniref:hypothetical protein n=1 Tax=Gordonia sp. B21 TaxID=3151852 RepID=UPI0032643345